MALGGDFEALKQLAKQQDADRQATLARERAAKEQQAVKAQAAKDARERQERENSRRLLKLKEDQKKRKAEAEEEMERKRAELRKRKREREQKAEEVAKTTKTKLITSKMIRQREKAGLGGRKSKTTSTSSSSDYLPLTRQEKRERREREVLGLDLRRMKAPPASSSIAGLSKLASAGSSSSVPLKSASSARNPSIDSKAAPPKKATTSAILRSLERQLVQAERAHKDARSLPESKESSIKVRDTEAAERDLRRKIAMERKAEEERQLARIRAGLPPLIDEGGSSEDEGRRRGVPGRTSKKVNITDSASQDGPRRPETAREKFLREEAERKQSSASKTAAVRSAKGAPSQGKKQKSMHFSESEDDSEEEGDDSDEEDDDDDDGFIDDGDEEGGYDIWSIMNPGKDKSKYLARQVDSDDDMEADADSVFREDQRSSALARLEDRREEERLRQHELEKARRKLDRGKRG